MKKLLLFLALMSVSVVAVQAQVLQKSKQEITKKSEDKVQFSLKNDKQFIQRANDKSYAPVKRNTLSKSSLNTLKKEYPDHELQSVSQNSQGVYSVMMVPVRASGPRLVLFSDGASWIKQSDLSGKSLTPDDIFSKSDQDKAE